jgi:nitroreductase
MQMDAFEALMTRRSVRTYTGEPVSDDQLRKILAAGMQAPSANNQQPWHFVIVRRRERLDRLAEVLPYGKMLRQAPLGIAVCADVERQPRAGYWTQDCAAATQNILLVCHATVTPLCAIAIGHPAERPAPVDRFRPERIHEEQW